MIEWTLDDVQRLINNNVKENINLDYKASGALQKNNDKKKDEMCKDISAFANSDGGTIIYGVTEKNNLPEMIDEGFDPTEISKEWIEQVINTRIKRRIDGVRIYQIDLKPERVIYAVSIPQSKNAPHMANDNRYYKRFNFESVPMEDYEIRDVMRRNESPDLHVEFDITSHNKLNYQLENSTMKYSPKSNPIKFELSVRNHSSAPAEYALFYVFIDARIEATFPSPFKLVGNRVLNSQLTYCYVYTWSITSKLTPIWEDIKFYVECFWLEFPNVLGDYILGWEVKAPGMTYKSDSLFIRSDCEEIKFLL
ncbi:helix-turn-helix domain-containing protein [Paenibacillus montanisoli]|nr:ATP-binding protein [Paenibacillus montanisoli]